MKAIKIMLILIFCTISSCRIYEPIKSNSAYKNTHIEYKPLSNFDCVINYEFHGNTKLDEFLQSQPSGSIDAIEITEANPFVIALVDVNCKKKENAKIINPSFITKFKDAKGNEIIKHWEGAKENNSGKYRTIITLPEPFNYGETILKN